MASCDEDTRLLRREEDSGESQDALRTIDDGEMQARSRRAAGGVVIFLVLVAAVQTVRPPERAEAVDRSYESFGSTSESSFRRSIVASAHQKKCLERDVCVLASNDYERSLDRPIANGLFDGILLEIFERTTLEVIAPSLTSCAIERTDPLNTGVVIDEFDNESSKGCTVVVHGSKVGVFRLTLSLNSESTTPLVQALDVTVKYVRRELRDLKVQARQGYFDAMETL